MQRLIKIFFIILLSLIFLIGIAIAKESEEKEEKAKNDYQIMESLFSFLNKEEKAILMAQRGIKEIYYEKKDMEKAIPILKEALKKNKNQTVRNGLHFTLSEIYKDIGQPEKAIEELKAIISENTKRLEELSENKK
ncbi:MAG: hypothetical protein DRG20_02040 [Deltaproteobacteria bacterium]|nr:tetratricopeptide repeat protein [Deltaproteobacteria bacterium]RLA91215.1 MAG: hypothetical protein DRG20_02040 [Deltaproteobacteria bacterium]